MCDLEESIELHRAALELHPSGHPDRASSLHWLAICISDRYGCQGAIADLEEAVTLGRAELELHPPGDPFRAISLRNVTFYLHRRFKRLARMCDLEESIELYRAALELCPSGHPYRDLSFRSLAHCLLDRYDNQGAVADLEEAVMLGRAELELHPPGDPLRSTSLYNVAYSLYKRFKKSAGMYDLEESIELHRAALELGPSGHPLRASSLGCLARCLSDRYDSQGVVPDLDEAITLAHAALELCPPGHLYHGISLSNLAFYLQKRPQNPTARCYREDPIKLRRAVLDLPPPEHPDRPSSLHSLALCLSNRYDSLGIVSDLEEAVAFARAATKLRPLGHPDRGTSLHSLAIYLRKRFQEHAAMCDLEEAIELHRAVLELRPSGHPDRASSLHSLVLCLLDRYDNQRIVADLEEAVTLGRATLELYPPTHPARASSLHDLALCLVKRFRLQHTANDLNEAIALEQETLQLLIPGDQGYDVSQRCLTEYLRMKISPQVVTMSGAPGFVSFDFAAAIRDVAFETLKTMPPRPLHTRTGVLCNRDAQLSHFMSSPQYKRLLSLCTACTKDQWMEHIKTSISGYFQFVTFSHRWGEDEPLLRDIERHPIYALSSEAGVGKLQAFCLHACERDYLWAWSDTCCIDKDSSAELQEAIGSMFAWYRRSALTIVHLSDVPDNGSFEKSEWFRRGWTLQELLAPRTVLFYTQNWSVYKDLRSSNHKTDVAVLEELEKVTGVESCFLSAFSPCVDDARSKLLWASKRCTTRPEDIAYSLFGIFNLHLPVLYGESAENALGRLLAEILSQSGDISILDWVGEASPFRSCFPARITSYQKLPLLPSQHNTERQSSTLNQQTPSPAALRMLHRSLSKSPLPKFINRRLILPCITHRVTAIQLKRDNPSASSYRYKIQASDLRPLQIVLPNKLEDAAMEQGALQLVRPWHSKLLCPSSKRDTTTDKQLLITLRRPFNALLLIELPHNEYKRIASSIVITAQLVDSASVLQSKITTLKIV